MLTIDALAAVYEGATWGHLYVQQPEHQSPHPPSLCQLYLSSRITTLAVNVMEDTAATVMVDEEVDALAAVRGICPMMFSSALQSLGIKPAVA